MRLLDLFCGAGGASEGYHRAEFEVVGVDIVDQKRYPFEFIRADALEVALEGFDAYHASPPCQAWTAYKRKSPGHVPPRPDLISPIRERLKATGKPYVLENILGAPLDNPVQLCGSSFGLDVRRHRLFEVNFPIMVPSCDHGWQTPRFAPAGNRTNLRSTVEIGVGRIPMAVQREAMGISWMVRVELTEAIPPAYTEHIGAYLSAALRQESP